MERFTTTIEAQKGATMRELTTIGLDVAKHTFQVVGCDRYGHEVRRKVLRRGRCKKASEKEGPYQALRRPSDER